MIHFITLVPPQEVLPVKLTNIYNTSSVHDHSLLKKVENI